MAKSTLVDSVRSALRSLTLVGQAASRDDLWSVIASRLAFRRSLRRCNPAPYRLEQSPDCDCVMLVHGPGPVRASAEQLREALIIEVTASSSGNALVDLTQTRGRAGADAAFLFEHSMLKGLRRLSRVALVVQREQLRNAHIDRANACRHGVQAEVFSDRRSAEDWLREFMQLPRALEFDRHDSLTE